MANLFERFTKSIRSAFSGAPADGFENDTEALYEKLLAGEQAETKGFSFATSPLLSQPIVTENSNGITLIRQPLVTDAITGWHLNLPQTDYDYQRAMGDPILNSSVAASLNWIIRTFPEAPLCVYERQDPDSRVFTPLFDHDMLQLVENPNPFYNDTLLWTGTLVSYNLSGNAYWMKVRDGTGKVVELYYAPHYCFIPRWPKDNSQWISHYDYRPGDGSVHKILPEDLVHFRFGMDSRNDRLGMSPLASVFREIFTDNEASNFSASLLRNLGVPGIIISPADSDTVITPDSAKRIKDGFATAFNRDHRGEPLVVSAGVKVAPVQLNPQQLDLKLLHRLPEERISAVLGIPAIVAGLGAGLDRSTMSNFKEAREMAFESNIIPTQRVLAHTLKQQLLVEFEQKPVRELRRFKVGFELSDVRILQDDENVRFQRWDIGVRGGWIKRSEARAAANLPVKPEDEIYLAGGNGGVDEMGQLIPGLTLPPGQSPMGPDGFPISTAPNVGNIDGSQPGLGGLSAHGQPAGPAKPSGLYNSEAIRAAQNIHRPTGASSVPPNPTGRGRGPGERRGYHGRFISFGGTDNAARNAPGSNSSGANNSHNLTRHANRTHGGKAEDFEAQYVGTKTALNPDDFSQLSYITAAELEYAYKYFRQANARSPYTGELITNMTETNIVRKNLQESIARECDAASSLMGLSLGVWHDQAEHTKLLAEWEFSVHAWIKVAYLNEAAIKAGGWQYLSGDTLESLQSELEKSYQVLHQDLDAMIDNPESQYNLADMARALLSRAGQ